MSDAERQPDSHRKDVLRLLLEQRQSLFGFILSIVRNFDRAEDVFQNVSTVICERYEKFQSGTNFGAWSREIARRCILEYRRSDSRLPVTLSDESLAHIQNGFDQLNEDEGGGPEERLKALRKCIQGLADMPRRLLGLRYRKGNSLDEIAGEVGRKSESVRKAMYRARTALKECIERRLDVAGENR